MLRSFPPLHLNVCTLAAALFSLVACGDSSPQETGDSDTSSDDVDSQETTDNGSTTEDGNPVWLEIGWGQDDFRPLQDGDTFEVVFGTQGSAMFPIIVRGGEFTLPPMPEDWQHADAPTVELWLDIDGHNDGFGDHFKRIANYPLGFQVLPDGTFESTYIAIILPDDKEPEALEGLAATLWLEISTADADPVAVQLDLTVALGELE